MNGHSLRAGALDWSSTLISSCSRDKTILHRDIRAQEDFVSKLVGHKSEVFAHTLYSILTEWSIFYSFFGINIVYC